MFNRGRHAFSRIFISHRSGIFAPISGGDGRRVAVAGGDKLQAWLATKQAKINARSGMGGGRAALAENAG